MLKNINWVVIKGEFEKAKGGIADDTPISLTITPKYGDQVTRRIRFGQFLEAMWRLYDSTTEIQKVNAIQKDGSSFFEYDTPADCSENKPVNGNGAVVLEFKNLTTTQREVYINILLTQILEDHICTQNNSIPPSGNPS
jgi:hypothetical protein